MRAAGRLHMLGNLLSGASALVLVLWARRLIPLHRVVALYGLGGVVGGLVEGRLGWKFGIAIPATFLALGLVEASGSRDRPVAVVAALGVYSVFDGYRSFFACCVLAATLTVWQMRPNDEGRERSRWWPTILIAGLLTAGYMLMSTLITAGVLGEAIQERTTEQIEQSGSLLAGGRPEWAATMKLVRLKPSGYGVGVIPNLEDVHTAKAGLESINIGLNQERDRYMFGTEFRLHSILADLWVRYGVVGVALGRQDPRRHHPQPQLLPRRGAGQHRREILAALLALWSLFFEPSTTYWVRTCVAVGLVLVLRDQRFHLGRRQGYDLAAGTAAGGQGGSWRQVREHSERGRRPGPSVTHERGQRPRHRQRRTPRCRGRAPGSSAAAGLAESVILALVAQAATAMVEGETEVSTSLGFFQLDAQVPVLLAIAGILAFVRLGLHLIVAYLPSRMAGTHRRTDATSTAAYSRSTWATQADEHDGHLRELPTNQIGQAAHALNQTGNLFTSGSTFVGSS